MRPTTHIRRFRANPIEGMILLVITTTLVHSIYSLFYSQTGFHPQTLTPMSSNPISEGRMPASASRSLNGVTLSLSTFDFQCNKPLDKDTSSTKIRLTGVLCGLPTDTGTLKIKKAVILNTTNQFNATVFSDGIQKKFSTDYIPLNPGKNQIHVEFVYQSGEKTVHEFLINRT